MSETLARCRACGRHVRAHETACPFCRSVLRRSAAAIALVGAGLSAAACARDSARADVDAAPAASTSDPPRNDNRGAAVYGGPRPRQMPSLDGGDVSSANNTDGLNLGPPADAGAKKK